MAGAVDDLGDDCTLDDGTPFRAVFRNDFLEDNFSDAKIDGAKSSLMMAAATVKALGIRKASGITVNGAQFIVRRVQPATSGFLKIILTSR